jgi:PAS domain S-box-containing protein
MISDDSRPEAAAVGASVDDVALRDWQTQWRNLFENAPIGIGITDAAGNLLAYNDALLEPGGYLRDDMEKTGNLAALCYVAGQREVIASLFAQPARLVNHPVQFRRKDGSPYDALMSLTPTTFNGHVCIQATVEDITERKRTETLLRQERELYLDLVNAQPAGIYRLRVFPGERRRKDAWHSSVDAPCAMELASDRFCDILGISRQVIEANPAIVNDLVYSEDKEDFARTNEDANARLILFQWEGRLLIGGTPRWVHFESLPRPVANGDVLWTGIVVDITERKRAEDQKATLEGQLRQAQKMELVGRLAGGVAHDFNNMLGVILGHTELALTQVDPSQPLHADLEDIRKAATRSADLTRQLLAFARRQMIAPEVLDLNEAVAGIIEMLRGLVGAHIDLTWRPGAGLWPAKMDPSQLDQILANLCLNARDAIAGAGKVTIETENTTLDEEHCAGLSGLVPGAYVRLVVSDDGRGMDKDALTRVFEPFYTTKGVGEGAGLGLASVYGAVRQHGGFIDVSSEPGAGTAFTIYLPQHAAKDGQPGTERVAAPATKGQETIPGRAPS